MKRILFFQIVVLTFAYMVMMTGCENEKWALCPHYCLAFEKTDTIVSSDSHEFSLQFLDQGGLFPDGWKVEGLAFDSADDPDQLWKATDVLYFYDKDIFFVMPNYLQNTDDGKAYGWLSARRTVSDGKVFLTLKTDANDSEAPRVAAVRVVYKKSDEFNDFLFGDVFIYQNGRQKSEPFVMKVR